MIVLTVDVSACLVRMPFPKETVADRLIVAEVVAFGREDALHRFSFTAVKVLKGKLSDPHVDVFADSKTRRRLNADEKRVVILVKSEDGWQSLGVADEEYQKTVKRILVFSTEWQGDEGRQKRVEYFLSLWGHQNRELSELAYLELEKAPLLLHPAIREVDLQRRTAASADRSQVPRMAVGGDSCPGTA